MKRLMILSLIACVETISGCGPGPGAPLGASTDLTRNESTTESESNTKDSRILFIGNEVHYEIKESHNESACTTGLQKFPSFASFCRGLGDEILNQRCAREEREKKYGFYCVQKNRPL